MGGEGVGSCTGSEVDNTVYAGLVLGLYWTDEHTHVWCWVFKEL